MLPQASASSWADTAKARLPGLSAAC